MPAELPEVHLTLAFTPTESFRKKISAWLQKEIGRPLFLKITVDKTILGGAIIIYNGRYQDASLRKKLDERLSRLS
jgi:F0F1-type ATP synthase delta subunit